jgi:cephalosporin hydroxylase
MLKNLLRPFVARSRAYLDRQPIVRRVRQRQDQTFFTHLIRKTDNFNDVTWLGQPVWQNVLDLWTTQETLCKLRPELLIECGTNRGGSSFFFASIFDLMNHGRVITVDLQKMHHLSHPRVTYLIGSSIGTEILDHISRAVAETSGPVMAVLDSDHSGAHVRREMEAYHRFVTPGSFLMVQDGVIDTLPMFAPGRPGPLAAIEEFLEVHPEFEPDTERSGRFLITHSPKGWLRRAG